MLQSSLLCSLRPHSWFSNGVQPISTVVLTVTVKTIVWVESV